MSLQGRPLPAAGVSYPAAQVEGQLSGGEIARPTGANLPSAARRLTLLNDRKVQEPEVRDARWRSASQRLRSVIRVRRVNGQGR